MNIWIMRHGEAEPFAPTDLQRALTEEGRKMSFEQGKWIGEHLINQGVKLDKIIVSPYTRTRQTYKQVVAGMQAVNFVQSFANSQQNGIVSYWDKVIPSSHPNNVCLHLDILRGEGAKNVLIISHLPLVLELTQELVQQPIVVPFSPATVICIEWFGENGKIIAARAP